MKAKVTFTPENLRRFQDTLAKYEHRPSALLPTLYLAQEQFGYLSPDVLTYVSSLLDMPPAQVFEAASFYTLFKKQPMGKWLLQVCNNITCTMMGSEGLLQVAKEELGVGPGGKTPDGNISLLCVQCLGSCDTAPVVQINEDYHEKLDPNSFRSLIRSLKKGETAS